MTRSTWTDIISFIEWIVYKLMIGDRTFVDAMYMYCVEGKPPAEISKELNISPIKLEHQIRYAMYLIKSRFLCKDVLSKIRDYLDEVPIIARKTSSGNYECLLCGRVLRPAGVVQHIKGKHIKEYRDVVMMLVRIYWERRGSV